MFVRLLKTAPIILLATAAAGWAIGWGSASAYAQCGCSQTGGHAGHGAESAGHQHETAHDEHAGHDHPADGAQPAPPPHGGQVTKAEPLSFEVVYLPQEIRVYIYGLMPYPKSAKEVRGEVLMQVRDNPRIFRSPLSYVAPPAGSGEQDYLAAAVDLTHVRDGDMMVTLNLENLPLPQRPNLTFSQVFALSRTKPQVTTAALSEGDRDGIARQKVCPVTGAELGSMGDPIKVLVGGQPLYLCCKGCLSKVQGAPEAYLRKAGQTSQGQ